MASPAKKSNSEATAVAPKKTAKSATPAPKTAATKAPKVVAVEMPKKAAAKAPKAVAVETPKKVAEKTVKAVKAAPKSKPQKASERILLTDTDVLRMPERDYMNEAQLNFFKTKLQLMKEEILANARETGEHLKENEVFADPNDRATVEEENMLEQRVRDRERKLLKKIDSALARIESGEYGFCLETGEPIGIPRLLARPTAELSIEAQEKHERMERLYAD